MATATPSGDDRKKALDDALASIQKAYGKGSIMRMGEAPQTVQSGVIPTGSLSLDLALGVGGVPRGRIRRPGANGQGAIGVRGTASVRRG